MSGTSNSVKEQKKQKRHAMKNVKSGKLKTADKGDV
jgi:hypothetical protein